MTFDKPISKMNKKDLVQALKDYQKLEDSLTSSMMQMEERDKQHKNVENKLKEEKHEVITALEVWKSGYLDMQDLNTTLQNRLTTLRKILQLELVKTPIDKAETKTEKDSITRSIVKKLARKLIDMEDKVKPVLHTFLPMPQILRLMQEERDRRQQEKKQYQLEEELSEGLFSHMPAMLKK